MAVKASALRTDRPLPLGRFMVLISLTAWVEPRAIVQLKELGYLKKKFNDLTWNGTREHPACSIVSQYSAHSAHDFYMGHNWSTSAEYVLVNNTVNIYIPYQGSFRT
jgi:hypothetical protein